VVPLAYVHKKMKTIAVLALTLISALAAFSQDTVLLNPLPKTESQAQEPSNPSRLKQDRECGHYLPNSPEAYRLCSMKYATDSGEVNKSPELPKMEPPKPNVSSSPGVNSDEELKASSALYAGHAIVNLSTRMKDPESFHFYSVSAYVAWDKNKTKVTKSGGCITYSATNSYGGRLQNTVCYHTMLNANKNGAFIQLLGFFDYGPNKNVIRWTWNSLDELVESAKACNNMSC